MCTLCRSNRTIKSHNIDGIKNSHLNFVNKKLSLEIIHDINEDKVNKRNI